MSLSTKKGAPITNNDYRDSKRNKYCDPCVKILFLEHRKCAARRNIVFMKGFDIKKKLKEPEVSRLDDNKVCHTFQLMHKQLWTF